MGSPLLVALGINLIVGGGIFGLPSKVFALAGSASLVVYGICAVAIIPIILCFAESAGRFAETGGLYLYAREAFGPVIGFEVGWLRWISGVASCAANSALLTSYLAFLLPAADNGVCRTLVVAAVVAVLTLVNVKGVREGAWLGGALAIAKLAPLLLFIVVGLCHMNGGAAPATAVRGLAGMSGSALLLMFAFTGFESAGIPAGESRDPRHSVPLALIVAISLVTVLYVCIQAVCMSTLPTLATSARPLADAAGRFLGPSGAALIAVGAIVSILGNLNGQILVIPRLLLGMAEREQLPGVLGRLHPRFGTPAIALALTSAAALALTLSGTFAQLAAISVSARLVCYLVVCCSVPALRVKRLAPPASFRLPFGSLIPVVALLVCLWLLSGVTRREGLTTGAAVLVGLALYFFVGKRAETRRR